MGVTVQVGLGHGTSQTGSRPDRGIVGWTGPKTTKPPARGPAARRILANGSDHTDVLGFLALAAGGHVELDALALVEGLVAGGLDVGVMDEHVVAVFA